MTNDEKAKAYDEALERARKIHNEILDNEILGFPDQIREIFPELRGSEDERIRKWLIDYFSSIKKTVWIHRDITCEQILEWLEKQKESLHIPETCKESADSFTSEDEKIRKELINFLRSPFIKENLTDEKVAPWLVWLEKQKEPTTEELYAEAGTTEKEYIANTMKMVRAMREKQKEQKPAEWSEVELEFRGEKVKVKRPFYRDDKGRGYSTAELDEEVAWNALRAWCEKKGISLYDLYPKAEWSEEDADILNCCISSIEEAKENRYAYKETDGDTSYDREIAFLKSLRPSWKPSEEHLSALLAVFNDPNNIGSQTCQLALSDLYEQLKKL